MTRQEHRAEAEKLLRLAAQESWTTVGQPRRDKDQGLVDEYIAVAHVHALLALTAVDAPRPAPDAAWLGVS